MALQSFVFLFDSLFCVPGVKSKAAHRYLWSECLRWPGVCIAVTPCDDDNFALFSALDCFALLCLWPFLPVQPLAARQNGTETGLRGRGAAGRGGLQSVLEREMCRVHGLDCRVALSIENVV